jgi:hypothetical protein
MDGDKHRFDLIASLDDVKGVQAFAGIECNFVVNDWKVLGQDEAIEESCA